MKRLVLLLVLLLPVVHAADVLKAEVVVFDDGGAVIRSLQPTFGVPDEMSAKKQDFMLSTNNFSTFVPVSFIVEDIPEKKVRSMLVVARLPYTDVGSLNILFNNSLVTSYDLSGLCNANGVCDGFENYLSCALDCPLASPDNVCVSTEDAVCDPDCAVGVDIDCVAEDVKQKTGLLIVLVVFGVLVPLVSIVYRLRRR
jgi:hypothetical protein